MRATAMGVYAYIYIYIYTYIYIRRPSQRSSVWDMVNTSFHHSPYIFHHTSFIDYIDISLYQDIILINTPIYHYIDILDISIIAFKHKHSKSYNQYSYIAKKDSNISIYRYLNISRYRYLDHHIPISWWSMLTIYRYLHWSKTSSCHDPCSKTSKYLSSFAREALQPLILR